MRTRELRQSAIVLEDFDGATPDRPLLCLNARGHSIHQPFMEVVMKLWSAAALVAPQKFPLILFAIAAAAACSSPMAFAQGEAGPRSGTEAAVQCLLRQGADHCEHLFVGKAMLAAQPWVWQDPKRDFNRGSLVFSKYFGQASPSNVFDEKILHAQMTDEMDIYDVKFAHLEWSIYVAPAGTDGKIHYLAIRLYPPHDLNQLQT
jgi:hypothetical protein